MNDRTFRMAVLLTAVLAATIPRIAFASTFTVVNLDDSGQGSLRRGFRDSGSDHRGSKSDLPQ